MTDDGIGVTDLARALEERRFESLFIGEHTHLPVDALPTVRPGFLADRYPRLPAPLVTLSFAAAVTENLRVGTSVLLLTQRDPIVTAKETATLDRFSGGRLVMGVGAGGIHGELRNHGTDPATRRALLRERVLAVKEIWTCEKAEFHGGYVDFDPIVSWPKPVQRPHPPVLLGGSGRRTLERVVEYADGWLPLYVPGTDLDALAADVEFLRGCAAAAGRAEAPQVTIVAVPPEADVLRRLRDIGVDRATLDLPRADRDTSLRTLDSYAALLDG
ncbi:LLM class F420-dependent oxidoreductase [Streptomyces sp. MST-110588]|uniref:LLM class F420-dependent oxidoreductase n=1 Tax=Streptomyces sp. MST-110588 TaxID=2833628 RepID=UPI001F5D05D8|nr:LLM class F420-dependent oxidoreductase [Streptomyces sp. MST-110588]UNO42107.1 LLM class F420-dependent oxidoreductase [Streptomyces sp. MST-110588]